MVHAVNRKLTSPEVQNILKHEESNTDMYIFVKKEMMKGNISTI